VNIFQRIAVGAGLCLAAGSLFAYGIPVAAVGIFIAGFAVLVFPSE